MRLELFGAIALTTLAAIACDSEEEAGLGQGAGAGGATAGTGGAITGTGATTTGNGGSQTGNGGTAGAGGAMTIPCPASQPTDGEQCAGTTGRAGCAYGNTNCRCSRQQGGTDRAWNCFTLPDGGFPQPGGDGGFTIPDGGFTPPATCTAGSDCTGGNICCSIQGGRRGTAMICITSAFCTQAGGTPVP